MTKLVLAGSRKMRVLVTAPEGMGRLGCGSGASREMFSRARWRGWRGIRRGLRIIDRGVSPEGLASHPATPELCNSFTRPVSPKTTPEKTPGMATQESFSYLFHPRRSLRAEVVFEGSLVGLSGRGRFSVVADHEPSRHKE